jgi:molybdopterin biosynthesis enzyme
MTPLDAAQALVWDACRPLPSVDVDRREARGLVLASEVVAAEQVPPFDNSAVDGYAVRADDLTVVPVELDVVCEIAAGAAPSCPVGAGQAIRIMTGAPIPPGATAVAMVEDSEMVGPDRVRLLRSIEAGMAVRRAGDDVQIGDVLFLPGTEIRPAVEAVLARRRAWYGGPAPVRRAALTAAGRRCATGSGRTPNGAWTEW